MGSAASVNGPNPNVEDASHQPGVEKETSTAVNNEENATKRVTFSKPVAVKIIKKFESVPKAECKADDKNNSSSSTNHIPLAKEAQTPTSILKRNITQPQSMIQGKTREWTQFEIEALNAHNNFRYKHGAPPLALDEALCQLAQAHADFLAKEKEFEHSVPEKRLYHGETCGESIAATGCAGRMSYSGYTAVQAWYAERDDYDHSQPEESEYAPSYTQLLWKGTRLLGQARASRKEGVWTHQVAVAMYYPPGNIQGQFKKNVEIAKSLVIEEIDKG